MVEGFFPFSILGILSVTFTLRELICRKSRDKFNPRENYESMEVRKIREI